MKKEQAVNKGYEDGLMMCKQHPLSDYLHFIGFLPEMSARACIPINLLELYGDGFRAAWRKVHDKSSTPYGSYQQAIMRDLEQS